MDASNLDLKELNLDCSTLSSKNYPKSLHWKQGGTGIVGGEWKQPENGVLECLMCERKTLLLTKKWDD